MKTSVLLWIMALVICAGLFSANIFLGGLNQDEGWYLYASRLVSEGKAPYIDFASTQGPVMPYFYTFAKPLVDRWGVMGGRLFTAFLGFLSALCSAWLAARVVRISGGKSPWMAAIFAFMLVGINVYQCYFCAIVKTYALASLLLTLSFIAMTYLNGPLGFLCSFSGGIFAGLAAGTRLSAGLVIPVILIWLFIRTFKKENIAGNSPYKKSTMPLLLFALGSVVSLVVIFMPFALRAPRALWFAMFEFHGGRDAGGGLARLAYKAGFISRLAQDYFVFFSICALLFLRFVFRRGNAGEKRKEKNSFTVMMFWSVLAVTAVHFLTNFPYDDYQVIVYPLAGVLVAVILARWLTEIEAVSPGHHRFSAMGLWLVFLLCVASSLSSPINQEWFVAGRDRVWWPIRHSSPLNKLRETAEMIKELGGEDSVLLTQDPYLAVQTGMKLPEGLEMGPFSYFPDWSRDKASACHVLNREMLLELLASCRAPVAALSEWSFAIESPSITRAPEKDQLSAWDVVNARYVLFRDVEDFGQADTVLKVFLLR